MEGLVFWEFLDFVLYAWMGWGYTRRVLGLGGAYTYILKLGRRGFWLFFCFAWTGLV